MHSSDDPTNVKAREFQIYKEACLLGASYNKELRTIDLRVMQSLLSYMNHINYTCFPGINTLTKPLPAHKRSGQRSLQVLTDKSHLRRSRRWNKQKKCWSSSVYLPLIPDCVMPALEIFLAQPLRGVTTSRLWERGLKRSNSSGVDLSLGADDAGLVSDGGFVTRGGECHEGSGVDLSSEPLTLT